MEGNTHLTGGCVTLLLFTIPLIRQMRKISFKHKVILNQDHTHDEI